jgi:O-antigen/teichoic acid export membrane protein
VRRFIKLWKGNKLIRHRLVDVGHLLTGNFAASMIGFAAFALTARAIGAEGYGVLAMIYAWTRAIERLTTFQSWQPLIRYAAGLNHQTQRGELAALYKFGLTLDIAGALSAFLISAGLAWFAGSYIGLSAEARGLVVLYSTTLLFHINGMPTAVMRLAGRFRMLAYGQVAGAVFRFACCLAAYLLGGGLLVFALVWMAVQVFTSLMLLVMALLELRRQGVVGLVSAPLRGITARFPGLWNFAWSSYLSLTIRASAQEFDTLLVGAIADPTSAGMFHMAKRIGRLALQAGVQVQAVLYPDVARLWAKGAIKEFKRATLQVEVLLGTLGLLIIGFFWFAAEPLLRWTAGAQFSEAAPLLLVQGIAVAASLAGVALRSALLAMGRQQQILYLMLAGTAAFYATALLLIPAIGAMGANFAHIALSLILLVGMNVTFRRALRSGARKVPATTAGIQDDNLDM